MAVQPIYRTREQLMVEALGERVPVELAGRFTLYARSKSSTRLYIHDKRNAPESLPVGSMFEAFGKWSITDADGGSFRSEDPIGAFRWWLGRHGGPSAGETA